MSRKIKSAYELAMERLAKTDPSVQSRKFSDAQKNRITDVRKEYQAKIAEREIMLKSKLNELRDSGDYKEFLLRKSELEINVNDAVQVLKLEMERKIEAIRDE